MRHFGYHITGGENIGTSLLNAVEGGFTAAQMFLGPPQSPRLSKISDFQKQHFLKVKRDHNIKCYVHAPYVLHAFAKPENAQKNNHTLKTHITLADELEMDGYVIHMGSTKSYYQSLDTVRDDPCLNVFAAAHLLLDTLKPYNTKILFENCASGNELSGRLRVIYSLVAKLLLESYNVGICLDTCHAWAWGDDQALGYQGSVPHTLVDLVHLNSAPEKVTFGCKRDLHESLSLGTIPLYVFKHFLYRHPEMPVIVERDSYNKVIDDLQMVREIDRLRDQGIPEEDLSLLTSSKLKDIFDVLRQPPVPPTSVQSKE